MNRITLVIVLLALFRQGNGQRDTNDWKKLVPLTSSRAEVEKVLGKPLKYFPTSGTYESSVGKFHVWYSRGKCVPGLDERQWDVPAEIMTNLTVLLYKSLPLDSYVPNPHELQRKKEEGGDNRFLYITQDDSVVYETIVRPDGSEFVYTITLQPAKNQHGLLCGKKKAPPSKIERTNHGFRRSY
jgi:hypothetical protein